MVNVTSQRYKRIDYDYDYDLISGKVNKVIYQPDARICPGLAPVEGQPIDLTKSPIKYLWDLGFIFYYRINSFFKRFYWSLADEEFI
jgi:hypothetical protein